MSKGRLITSSVETLTQELDLFVLGNSSGEPAIEEASEEQCFMTIQNLFKEQAVLLFTPAISSRTDIDPFEALGRAIHSHHRKVRHVPYSLKDGFTYVHEAHLADPSVGAVLLVVLHGDVNQTEWLQQQKKFSSLVLEGTNRPEGTTLPAVRLRISKRQECSGNEGWDSEIWCDGQQGPVQFTRMAERMFGTRL